MRLSTQFRITLIVFSVVLVIIASSAVVTSEQISQARAQENFANNVVQGASDLAYLSNDYVVYRGQQQLEQWETRYASLSNDVGNLSATTGEQQALISDIRSSQQNLRSVFDNIVSFIGSSNNTQPSSQTLQTSWSRISIQSETLILDATRLAQSLRTQVDDLNILDITLTSAAISAFAVFIIAIYLQTFRRTLRSINELQAGTKVIGSGSLDYKLNENSKDEIGDLSRSFNQMTADLRNTTNQLKDAERMVAIGQTAGMVGHDIRNPLQAIVGDLYLLQMDIETMPDRGEKEDAINIIKGINDNITYINKIIADLQDYARKTTPSLTETDLEDVINAAFSNINVPANIKAECLVEPNTKIQTDPAYIRRIITNLSTNAIQAMPNGGELTINVRREQNFVKIEVADTGEGIPKEVQEKLFKPLFTTKSKGQGFGLPVVKKFVEELGGTISFYSNVGKGTTFTIILPSGKDN